MNPIIIRQKQTKVLDYTVSQYTWERDVPDSPYRISTILVAGYLKVYANGDHAIDLFFRWHKVTKDGLHDYTDNYLPTNVPAEIKADILGAIAEIAREMRDAITGGPQTIEVNFVEEQEVKSNE